MVGSVQDPGSFRFGRCLHPGATSLLGRTYQEYVWLDAEKLSHPTQLTKILGMWDLEPPNLSIFLTGGWIHPKLMIKRESLVQPELKGILDRVQETLQFYHKRFPKAKDESGEAPKAKDKSGEATETNDAELLSVLGDALLNRLVDVMVALVEACAQTNSWLILEGENGLGQLPYLLELALTRTQSKPTILALVDEGTERFNQLEHCHQAWELLGKQAITLPEGSSTENLTPLKLPNKLFDGTLEKLWPDGTENCGSTPYAKWCFRGASHYMFRARTAHTPGHGSAMPFPVEWLGSVGNVFSGGASGQADTSDQLIFKSMKAGVPTIILKHTGCISDIWGHIVEILQKKPKVAEMGVDAVIKELDKQYPVWFHGDESSPYGMKGLKANFYPFISGIQTLPEATLKSSVVVVNSWTDSAETLLTRLSSCFAACAENITELGANGADEALIMDVWRQQGLLYHNRDIFRSNLNRLTIGGAVVSVLSTTLAVTCTYTEVQTQGAKWAQTIQSSKLWHYITIALMVLPAIGGLVTSILSKLRYGSKWAVIYMAAENLESEIYKFRAKAKEYDPTRIIMTRNVKDKTKAKQEEEITHLSPARLRAIFVSRTADIIENVMSSDVQQDGLTMPANLDDVLVQRQLEQMNLGVNREEQLSHFGKVEKKVSASGQMPATAAMSLLEKNMPDYGAMQDTANVQEKWAEQAEKMEVGDSKFDDDMDADDLINSLSNEEYFSFRTLPKLEQYRNLAPRLAYRLMWYEMSIVACSMAAAVLGAIGMMEWIPLPVALGAVLTSLLQYETLQPRISAANAAIQDLSYVQSRWVSAGVIEKRAPILKALMVEMTEGAIIREATAYTGRSMQSTSLTGKDIGCQDEESATGDKKAEGVKAK